MSDLTTQEEPQITADIQNQDTEVLNEVDRKSGRKKVSIPRLDISQMVLLFRQYGISIAINVVILGVVSFLFYLQSNWIKVGNKDIGRIVEEKVKETINKNLASDEENTKIAEHRENKGNNIMKQKNQMGTLVSKKGPTETYADNSKYIIEANRLYEQGRYESAANLYEKGLDKSMPFLNEDFVMYRLGDCYLMSGKHEEALKVFQTLNTDYINSPHQFKSRLKMGECYAGMGEFKKARKTLYTIVAQEGKCSSDDDKLTVIESYFKIADYYMEESQRLRKAADEGTSCPVRSLASK